VIKTVKAFLDNDGSVKARMEDFPPEAFTQVYGRLDDGKNKLVAIARKCLNYRANSITQFPYQVERNGETVFTSEDKNIPPEYEVIKSVVELIREVELSLCRFSKAFINHAEMRMIYAPSVDVISDKITGEILYYIEKIDRKEYRHETDDLIYIYETSDKPGKPLQSIIDTIEFDSETLNNIDNYLSAFFKNGAIKTTLLTIDGYPTNDETDRLEDHLKRVATGVKNAFKTKVLRMPITPVVIGSGLEDFDPVLTQNKINDIVTAFEIPPSLVLANAANYATALSDKKEFYSSILSPRVNMVAKEINDQWLSTYNLRLTFLPDKLQVMRVDESIRSQSLLNMINAGFDLITATEILGYDLSNEQLARLKENENKKDEMAQNKQNPNQDPNQDPEDDLTTDVVMSKSYRTY